MGGQGLPRSTDRRRGQVDVVRPLADGVELIASFVRSMLRLSWRDIGNTFAFQASRVSRGAGNSDDPGSSDRIIAAAAAITTIRAQLNWLSFQDCRLLWRDVTVIDHAIDDPVTPSLGRVRVMQWIIVARGFGQPAEKRGFVDGKLRHRLAEIILRCLRNPL